MLPFVICARNFELAVALAESIHRAVLLIPEWRDQPPIRYAAANTELFPGRPNQRPRRKDLDGGRDGHVLISLGTFALIFAVLDHSQKLRLLLAGGLELRFGPTMAVASVVAILGVIPLLSPAVGF